MESIYGSLVHESGYDFDIIWKWPPQMSLILFKDLVFRASYTILVG
jgi:hypothetical protein